MRRHSFPTRRSSDLKAFDYCVGLYECLLGRSSHKLLLTMFLRMGNDSSSSSVESHSHFPLSCVLISAILFFVYSHTNTTPKAFHHTSTSALPYLAHHRPFLAWVRWGKGIRALQYRFGTRRIIFTCSSIIRSLCLLFRTVPSNLGTQDI